MIPFQILGKNNVPLKNGTFRLSVGHVHNVVIEEFNILYSQNDTKNNWHIPTIGKLREINPDWTIHKDVISYL